MPKHVKQPRPPPECEQNETLGLSPAVLGKRGSYEPEVWCPKVNPLADYHDPWCDQHRPKTIHYHDVLNARRVVKNIIPATRLMKSHGSSILDMNLYFKLESVHKTGSFHERGAIYALHMLTDEQRKAGVVTASLGNWAMSLTSEAKKMDIPVSVFFPNQDRVEQVYKCKDLGANIEFFGKNLTEASQGAITSINDTGTGTYINGYDHPHVIAGEGTIGIEILEQLPETDVVIIPVGGGGLLAGIAAVVKKLKPDIQIYGVETNIGSCFFKALDNGNPYTIEVGSTQNVATAGYNAFHTARSLIDKMILVQDDWIAEALTHLAEEERLVVERMGALGLAAIFSEPNIVPELRSKNVVCVLTGSNYNSITWPKALQRGKTIDGRLVTIEMACPVEGIWERSKILRVLANLGCNIVYYSQDNNTLMTEEDVIYYNEDFDEFCDPENPKIIQHQDVVDAAERIRPYIAKTPCMAAHTQREFGIYIHYKLETLQKTGSFKERGALNALLQLPTNKMKLGIVIASTGNDALSFSYYAAKMNIPITVILPAMMPLTKQQHCLNMGAKVIVQGNNLNEAQKYARALAREKGLTYINGRDHPNILAGYGTLALEILEQIPFVDAVILPIGSSGLAGAIGTVIKHQKPSCLIYGVEAENLPIFFNSLEQNEPLTSIPWKSNLAGTSVAINNIGVNGFANAKAHLDKVLLVKDDWIARALLHLAEREKFVVEGGGALPLATIIGNLVPELKTKNVACILTGGNIDTMIFNRICQRGLAAEGRLIKFKVGVYSVPGAKRDLMKLIASGGYNVVTHFIDNTWSEGDTCYSQVRIVVETKGLEHALELKRMMDRAYPETIIFESEPFNDRRTCPCYIKKSK